MKKWLLTLFAAAAFFGLSAAEPLFHGETVIFPANATTLQMFSAIIVTAHGKVIVFDGGNEKDLPHLLEMLRPYGTTVHYWFITHAHSDHIGALAAMRKRHPDALKVEKLLYRFPSMEWLRQPKRCTPFEQKQIEFAFTKNPTPQQLLKKGNVIEVDGVRIEVLNDPDESISANAINNSSIVFAVTIAGKRLLITGDIGREMSTKLLREYGSKLKSDLVVMSHHGQHGATREFYAAVAPSIAVWPTPRWLWNNDWKGQGPGSGPWEINFVKCHLQQLKVKKQYVTGFGDVILK